MALKRRSRYQDGQAVTEYLLLLSLIVGIYLMVTQGIARFGLAKKLALSITGPYAASYQFGHPLAKGFDNGGPTYHPRVVGGENNFRIFLTPENK